MKRFAVKFAEITAVILLAVLFLPGLVESVLENVNRRQVEKQDKEIVFDAEMYPYYQMLNENGKQIYQELYAHACDGQADFGLQTRAGNEEVTDAFEALWYDHPELYWLDNTYQYQEKDDQVMSISLKINDLFQKQQVFEQAAGEILSSAEQLPDQYAREKYVHDALIDQVSYDVSSSYNQSAWSALVNHSSVCAGYARAFQYLMQKLSIPCYYVGGTSMGEEHGWNIVALDDSYYNVDVTWDDQENGVDTYYFFNLPDEMFDATHTRGDQSVNLPRCLSYDLAHIEDRDIWQNVIFRSRES